MRVARSRVYLGRGREKKGNFLRSESEQIRRPSEFAAVGFLFAVRNKLLLLIPGGDLKRIHWGLANGTKKITPRRFIKLPRTVSV